MKPPATKCKLLLKKRTPTPTGGSSTAESYLASLIKAILQFCTRPQTSRQRLRMWICMKNSALSVNSTRPQN